MAGTTYGATNGCNTPANRQRNGFSGVYRVVSWVLANYRRVAISSINWSNR
jgi:hypothetical protein